MSTQPNLREKLRKIEALLEGADTPAERSAAEAALARVQAKLDLAPAGDPPVEQNFFIADESSRYLFVALCRRNGIEPFRRVNDQAAAVTVFASRRLVEGPIWRQFKDLEEKLHAYLSEVTLKLIRDEIHADAGDAIEVQLALPPPDPEPVLLLTPADRAPWFGWPNRLKLFARARSQPQRETPAPHTSL